jgi:hypothetical protein
MIDVCTCGTVGVHFGNASIRMPRDAFFGFCRMVDEAFANRMAQALAAQDANAGDSEESAHDDAGE